MGIPGWLVAVGEPPAKWVSEIARAKYCVGNWIEQLLLALGFSQIVATGIVTGSDQDGNSYCRPNRRDFWRYLPTTSTVNLPESLQERKSLCVFKSSAMVFARGSVFTFSTTLYLSGES